MVDDWNKEQCVVGRLVQHLYSFSRHLAVVRKFKVSKWHFHSGYAWLSYKTPRRAEVVLFQRRHVADQEQDETNSAVVKSTSLIYVNAQWLISQWVYSCMLPNAIWNVVWKDRWHILVKLGGQSFRQCWMSQITGESSRRTPRVWATPSWCQQVGTDPTERKTSIQKLQNWNWDHCL